MCEIAFNIMCKAFGGCHFSELCLIASLMVFQATGVSTCDHTIGLTVSKADGRTNYAAVQPGDTVCLAAGSRNGLVLRNFFGSPDNPITFINAGGQVVFNSSASHGILVQNSRFFHLSGSGSEGIHFGLKVTSSTQDGISIGYKSSDFELDHIEISGVPGVGIAAKTEGTCSDGSTNDYDYDGDGMIHKDPDDAVNRDTFIQYDTVIHSNYIHDVGTEGFYIGSSLYSRGWERSCDSGPETVYPPLLRRVHLFDNIVTDTGWDAIQVGSATEHCEIYGNRVLRDGQAGLSDQESGIMSNPGSACHIYNNFIKDGGGPGIYLQGNGGNEVYNNVIVNAGQNKPLGNNSGDGITIFTGSNPGNGVRVFDNIIVSPRNFGIKYYNFAGSDNTIQNNIIVAPGNYGYGAYGENAYIHTFGLTNVNVFDNLMKPSRE
ncbi:MAG: right-handed parallel beta-helix repeat-containing protein [Anaerolineae bacterium]